VDLARPSPALRRPSLLDPFADVGLSERSSEVASEGGDDADGRRPLEATQAAGPVAIEATVPLGRDEPALYGAHVPRTPPGATQNQDRTRGQNRRDRGKGSHLDALDQLKVTVWS
jgi:hypothetical protein